VDYAEATAKLTGRCKESRKLENNTYLKRRSASEIAIRLHHTDIIIFHNDGRIGVSTGGWNTVTTKDRINRYLPDPWSVWSESGCMFIGHGWSEPKAAFDGNSVTIEYDGAVTDGIPPEEMRRQIKDAINEARRPANRARYWIRKARGIFADRKGCHAERHWGCELAGRWNRRRNFTLEAGQSEKILVCGCRVVRVQPKAPKLTVQTIMTERNQTVRAAMMSIYGVERFVLDAGAKVIEERDGYQLLEITFNSRGWQDRLQALKMVCPSTAATYINTVPPGTDTVEAGLGFMFDLPEGVNYFDDVVQQA